MPELILTKSKHLLPYAAILRAQGVSVSRLLRMANLPLNCLDDPDTLIPSICQGPFRELAAQKSGCANISVEACQHLGVGHLGDFGQLLLMGPTVAASLHKLCKFACTESSNLSIELQPRNSGDLWLSVRILSHAGVGDWHNYLYTLSWMLKITQLGDPAWSPAEIFVALKATPERFEEIEMIGSTARLEQNCTGFLIPASILALPVGKNTARGRVTDPDLQSTAPARTYAASLKQLVRSYASDGWLSIDRVSEVTNTSIRTLQRRLSTEQESYLNVVQQCRAEMAADLLENTDAPIAEIASQLGYKDPSNFTRAFYRWAKVSPSVFRKQRSHLH